MVSFASETPRLAANDELRISSLPMIFKVLADLQLKREQLIVLIEHARHTFPFSDFLVRVNLADEDENGGRYAGTQIVGIKEEDGGTVVRGKESSGRDKRPLAIPHPPPPSTPLASRLPQVEIRGSSRPVPVQFISNQPFTSAERVAIARKLLAKTKSLHDLPVEDADRMVQTKCDILNAIESKIERAQSQPRPAPVQVGSRLGYVGDLEDSGAKCDPTPSLPGGLWGKVRQSEPMAKARANQSWTTLLKTLKETDMQLLAAQEDLKQAKARLTAMDAKAAELAAKRAALQDANQGLWTRSGRDSKEQVLSSRSIRDSKEKVLSCDMGASASPRDAVVPKLLGAVPKLATHLAVHMAAHRQTPRSQVTLPGGKAGVAWGELVREMRETDMLVGQAKEQLDRAKQRVERRSSETPNHRWMGISAAVEQEEVPLSARGPPMSARNKTPRWEEASPDDLRQMC